LSAAEWKTARCNRPVQQPLRCRPVLTTHCVLCNVGDLGRRSKPEVRMRSTRKLQSSYSSVRREMLLQTTV
jgi:hypothetical protein